MHEQTISSTLHPQQRRRARAVAIVIAMSAAIAACVTSVEDEDEVDHDAEFRDGCDGVEEYIDENGEEVICVYTEDHGGGGDGGGNDGGGDPCWDYPWLCDPSDGGGEAGGDGGGEAGGGGDGGGEQSGCYDKLFAPSRSATSSSQQRARINAIEASRAKGREDCRHDWYYVGWTGAYCDTGVPDNDEWSNANSWVEGCEYANLQWTCTAHSTIFCRDYTYHGW